MRTDGLPSSGVVLEPPALYIRRGWALRWLEVSVTNGWFLVHALRRLVEAPSGTAERLASTGGWCRGVVGAA
jgi:hypothetical protein